MDSLLSAAARALAAGDPLGALKRVALREDPPALALRGIAMAQLGDYTKARDLLRRAKRAFGTREAVARARCVIAEAEVALAMRDFSTSTRTLIDAATALDARADHANAAQARVIAARRGLLTGQLAEAEAVLRDVDLDRAPAALIAVTALAETELAVRRLRTQRAARWLELADQAAQSASIPALLHEITQARAWLTQPAARERRAGSEKALRLREVEALLGSGALVIDACRRGVRCGDAWLPLASRPILFGLLRVLAEHWPADADRTHLIASVFRTRHADDTHRARLRVEMGRLRKLMDPLASVEATADGFRLDPRSDIDVTVLAPPLDGEQAELLALLSDGAAWSTSALALALDRSQRTVQRALADLEADGAVRVIGRARAQRWLAPTRAGFTTILLLPAALAVP